MDTYNLFLHEYFEPIEKKSPINCVQFRFTSFACSHISTLMKILSFFLKFFFNSSMVFNNISAITVDFFLPTSINKILKAQYNKSNFEFLFHEVKMKIGFRLNYLGP